MDRATAESERRERERLDWEKQWKRQKQKDQYKAVIAEAKQLELLDHLESYLQRIESQYKTQFGEIEENVAAWLNLNAPEVGWWQNLEHFGKYYLPLLLRIQ